MSEDDWASQVQPADIGSTAKSSPSTRRIPLSKLFRAGLILPVLLLEWAVIFVFFSFCVWFEIWVIFDWGGCAEYNRSVGEWKCLAADTRRGKIGLVMGALPSICEGAFFELLLAVSKLTANSLISLHHFQTTEARDFAFVAVVFVLEAVGKVGFILSLALAFVPVWDGGNELGCNAYWDEYLLGRISLGCLKGQVPYKVRLILLRSAMKGPMLVSGLVGIGVKTLLPMLLETWRWWASPEAPSDGCCSCCCRSSFGRCCLTPVDFVFRVLLLIFQADCGGIAGCGLLLRWPPTLALARRPGLAPGRLADADAEEHPKAHGQLWHGTAPGGLAGVDPEQCPRAHELLWSALLEGQRKEFDPFQEYLEMLLHFLWTASFAIVWPLGCVFALMNQVLEHRFDCIKLLLVRRRRFPCTRHMSVAWVPRFACMICHIAIFVNVAILLLPYRLVSPSSPQHGSEGEIEPILSVKEWPKTAGCFIALWVSFVSLRWFFIFIFERTTQSVDASFRPRHNSRGCT